MNGSSLVDSIVDQRLHQSSASPPRPAPASTVPPYPTDTENMQQGNEDGGPSNTTGNRTTPVGNIQNVGQNDTIRPCLLKSASGDDEKDQEEDVLLVHGPSQSGRTSVLMDLAMRLAAQTPCRCNNNNYNGGVSEQFTNNDDEILKDGNTECNCTAVLFLRLASNSNITASLGNGNGGNNGSGRSAEDHDRFPLTCYPIKHEKDDHHSGNNNNNKANSSSNGRSKDNLLRRIQVLHVVDIQRAYKDLLTVQGWPITEQPWGGIIVDDLDKMVVCRAGWTYYQYNNGHNQQHNNSATMAAGANNVPFASPPRLPPKHQPMPNSATSAFSSKENHPRMAQFLAILVNTAQFLQRVNGRKAVMVAATTNDALPSKVTNFCNPSVLRLKPCPSEQKQHHGCNDDLWWKMSGHNNNARNEVAESRWCVEMQQRSHHDDHQRRQNQNPGSRGKNPAAATGSNSGVMVQYVFLRSIDKGPRIVWRKGGE